MNITDFQDLPSSFQRINSKLNDTYGLSIDIDQTEDELLSVLQVYESRQLDPISTPHDEYHKTIMIREALRMRLREIAPARKPKRAK